VKKLLATLLIIASLCLMLTSCGSSKKALVGKWYPVEYGLGDDYYLELNSDGTGSYFGEDIKWKVKGSSIVIEYPDAEPMEMPFEIKDGKLITKDSVDEEVTWEKK
jgi:hypothetical protein